MCRVPSRKSRLGYKLVADCLGVTISTFRARIRTMYEKLQANSKAEPINCVRCKLEEVRNQRVSWHSRAHLPHYS